MKKNVLPHRSLVLWQLRAAVITFLAAFLLTLLLSDFHFWYRLSLMLTGIRFLFCFCVYYPLKRIKFTFFLHDGQLIVDCGVFYNRRRVIPLDNICLLYTSLSAFTNPTIFARPVEWIAAHLLLRALSLL